MSTETRRKIRDVTYGGFKIYLALTVGTICLYAAVNGVTHSRLERIYPTPHEWRFFTRWAYRIAAALEDDEGKGSPVDWPEAGPEWRKCLAKLEDTSSTDGQGLEQITAGLELRHVPIWDASKKSEQWRRGYFEVAMGCGRAAEHLSGWYQDKTRPRSRPVPADVIIGPSNLDPRPLPQDQGPPPREEDCKPVMEPPETYYQRIIYGQGFSRKQRLLATLALADYLDFRGNHKDAEYFYHDGLDLARSAFAQPENIVNRDTGIIMGGAPTTSSNVLLASTALAIHHAQTGNTAAALPIFLSAIRAIREGNSTQRPTSSASPMPSKPSKVPSVMDKLLDYLEDHPYPVPTSSGDEPLSKSIEPCSEASILAYVGEVLFATAKNDKDRERGMAWTKDAVDLAELRASQILEDEADDEKLGKVRYRFLADRNENDVKPCQQCLEVGLANWQRMIAQIMRKAEYEADEGKKVGGWYSWISGSSKSNTANRTWEKEQEDVTTRLEKFREERLLEMTHGRAGGKPLGLPQMH